MGQAVDATQAEGVAGAARQGARDAALRLIADSGLAMLGSVGPDGYPWIKAMMKTETEGFATIWFCTSAASARVAQFRTDPRACVYFVDAATYRTLLLLGDVEVRSDRASRERLWRDEFAMHYPLGIDDPNFLVLRFTTRSADYHQGAEKHSLTV